MLRIQVDTRTLFNQLDAAQNRQLPFAMSLALNRVANLAQEAERQHIRTTFKLRREAFVLRGVKIDKAGRATKTSWRVVIQLAYPDQRPFLDQHEEGGMRTRHGGKRLWQPNQQVFKSRVIGRSNPLHPKNLHLRKDKGRIVGDQRTFIIRTGQERLILQRIGSGGHRGYTQRSIDRLTLKNFGVGKTGHLQARKRRSRDQQTRLLYRLVERVKIPARLAFTSTITRTVASRWDEVAQSAVAEALRGRQ